jgi:hypothetical protein
LRGEDGCALILATLAPLFASIAANNESLSDSLGILFSELPWSKLTSSGVVVREIITFSSIDRLAWHQWNVD